MAFDSYNSNNQENQSTRKVSAGSNNLRQRSASNLRNPLSNVSTGRKTANDGTRSINSRPGESGPVESRGKNGSTKTRKRNEDDPPEHYDDIPENMYRPDKEDLAGWIHREKLAKIENEELQAAGINLAKARSKSRDPIGGRARDTSRDHRDRGSGSRDDKRQKMSSPVNDKVDDPTQEQDWDIRTPEEITNEEAAAQMYNTPGLRKSGSKIPVMTSSPTPIPSERYERETPMPRKRTLSGSIAPEETLRAVRGKLSQDGELKALNSNADSPTRQRDRTTGTPTTGQRKTSAQIPPNSYNNNINNPTATQSSEPERPRSSSRPPEGDPPWLATMYKPDPRLPPDQQLIPTLAKKQAQQAWEANGNIPSTYDRNFDAVQVYGAGGLPQKPSQQSPTELEASETWPLKPIPPPKPINHISRPTTSSGTGGYSTMPKVTAPPVTIGLQRTESGIQIPSRTNTPTGQIGQQISPQYAPTRLQQQPLTAEQEAKVEKKGCCCIVM